MKQYEKTFVNPLLAKAFKDGIEFANDSFLKVSEPKKEGDKWILLIEDTEEDDEINEELSVVVSAKVDNSETKKDLTWEDVKHTIKVAEAIEPKQAYIDDLIVESARS